MKDSHGWRIDPKKERDSVSSVPGGSWAGRGAGGWSDIIILFIFFISFSFPFHLAAASCETGSLLQCFTDAFPLGSNAKDLCVKTGHFPIIIPFEPMLLSKKVDVSVL